MASLTYTDYHLPTSVDEALEFLAQHHGHARVIAGGTDLMIDMLYPGEKITGGAHPQALVDVTRIPQMNTITIEGDTATIGAAVTHAQIVKHAALEARATALVEACGVVGGPQVRNVATLGGNVAHALPAADGTSALVALNAEALVAWADGRQTWQPITDLFKGAGESMVDPRRDVLVGFRFALSRANEGSSYGRIMRPQGVALPVLVCAVAVRLNDVRTHLDDVRVCISPVAPKPVRAHAVENVLRGQLVEADLLTPAIAAAHETMHPRTSKYRATGEYRQYMIESLLSETLPRAIERAFTGTAVAVGVGM